MPRGAEPVSTSEWSLVATLHHRPGRPTGVELAPGTERIDVDAWSRSEGWCEHCRTRRSRRTTYLLRRRNGSLAQIGSTLPRRIHRGAQPDARSPARAVDCGLRCRGTVTGRRGRQRERLHRQLTRISPTLHKPCSMMASSRAAPPRAGKPATWSRALATLDVARSPSARARRRAQQTVEWVREELTARPTLDDFERRLVQVLGQDRLTFQELPTAAAGIFAYHQHLRKQIEAREKAGDYLGEPGEVITASLVVRRVERVATAGGPIQRHFLRDELGRIAVWDAREPNAASCSRQPRGRGR